MYRNDFAEPTFDRHLPNVLETTTCNKHGAEKGHACWEIGRGENGFLNFAAACNSRARKAGMVGKISPQSLNLKHRGGNRDKRR